MPAKKETPADRCAENLGAMIGQAADRNSIAQLGACRHQALGAWHATGETRFADLANYASRCAVAVDALQRSSTQRH